MRFAACAMSAIDSRNRLLLTSQASSWPWSTGLLLTSCKLSICAHAILTRHNAQTLPVSFCLSFVGRLTVTDGCKGAWARSELMRQTLRGVLLYNLSSSWFEQGLTSPISDFLVLLMMQSQGSRYRQSAQGYQQAFSIPFEALV